MIRCVLFVMLTGLGPWTSLLSFGQVPTLSKEYIYLGDRILAVESFSSEPIVPGALTATANGTTQVVLNWSAPASGSPDHYGVWRSSDGVNWSRIAEASSLTHTDTTVSASTAYLYKVSAEDGADQVLGSSNVDLATTVSFSDDPLNAQVTVVRAAHVDELRTAVNAVRAAAGLGAAGWTNGSLSGAWIKAIDVTELRTNLSEAIIALALTAPNYTDPTLTGGVTIKKIHFEQLRDGVK